MCRGGMAAKAHHGSRARSDRCARSNTSLIRFVRYVRSPSPIGLTSLSSLSTLIRSCTRIAVCRCAPCCRGSVCRHAAPAHVYLYSYICISVYICISYIFTTHSMICTICFCQPCRADFSCHDHPFCAPFLPVFYVRALREPLYSITAVFLPFLPFLMCSTSIHYATSVDYICE